MSLPVSRHFDAYLPRLAVPVRIESFDHAKIFTRRWVIRDKDRTLKALLRSMDRVNSTHAADAALRDFKQALEERGLLVKPAGTDRPA